MKQVYVLDTRKETINIYIIYKMIIEIHRKKFNYQNYLEKIISLVNPNLVITSIDNHIPFFQLKTSFENIMCKKSLKAKGKSGTGTQKIYKLNKRTCSIS